VKEYNEYCDLREKDEREQRVLCIERNRCENTKSMVISEKRVRE
jgi:hypothetical protein